ncbi:MAG: hypothetical protein PHU46_02200 [Rhodocyclaceae bacterium]|nr:hypothetical protein [Rhodocyclaceae bacterium]
MLIISSPYGETGQSEAFCEPFRVATGLSAPGSEETPPAHQRKVHATHEAKTAMTQASVPNHDLNEKLTGIHRSRPGLPSLKSAKTVRDMVLLP